MDGCELLRCIRQDTTGAAIPVVMLSSSRAEADVLRSYASQANCYVTKPLDLDEYLALIGSVQHYWLVVARLPRSKTNG
jgi:CheY-like chemotaxis protein